jgi:hypothetical protein
MLVSCAPAEIVTWQELKYSFSFSQCLIFVPPTFFSCFQNLTTTLWKWKYSETSIYRSWIIRFPGSVIQFLWSLSESYFNYGSRIYSFPGSIISFSDPRRKRWIEVSLYFRYQFHFQDILLHVLKKFNDPSMWFCTNNLLCTHLITFPGHLRAK